MSEITKLYENAGVLKECLSPCYINETWRKTHDCPNCDNRESYPPFTAEKQLELIKWISHHDGCFKVYLNSIEFGDTGFGSCFTFEESLAKAVSNFLMSATDKEKQRIKEILE